jgi:hypothetical protein
MRLNQIRPSVSLSKSAQVRTWAGGAGLDNNGIARICEAESLSTIGWPVAFIAARRLDFHCKVEYHLALRDPEETVMSGELLVRTPDSEGLSFDFSEFLLDLGLQLAGERLSEYLFNGERPWRAPSRSCG